MKARFKVCTEAINHPFSFIDFTKRPHQINEETYQEMNCFMASNYFESFRSQINFFNCKAKILFNAYA